jgi:hypothetical protein
MPVLRAVADAQQLHLSPLQNKKQEGRSRKSASQPKDVLVMPDAAAGVAKTL